MIIIEHLAICVMAAIIGIGLSILCGVTFMYIGKEISMTPSNEEMDRCERMLTDCTCLPDYFDRGLTDPNCMACQLGSEIIDTFKAMRSNISQQVSNLSEDQLHEALPNWAEFWWERGNEKASHDYQAFLLAEQYALAALRSFSNFKSSNNLELFIKCDRCNGTGKATYGTSGKGPDDSTWVDDCDKCHCDGFIPYVG